MEKLESVTGHSNALPGSAPFDMLLFGATGDLALRKLVPALYRRHLAGQIVAGSRVLAVARTSQSREVYIAQIEETCRKYLRAEEFTAERWLSFAALLDYVTVDATQPQDFKKLVALLAGREDVVRVIFLSTAPSLFTLTCNHLAASGLVTPKSPRSAGKAAGPGPQVRGCHQPQCWSDLRRAPDLSHRPLPGQGDGPEPDRAAFRKYLV